MKYSYRDVSRLAIDQPFVQIPKLNNGCRAILQWLAKRPDDWQAMDSLNVGTLLDVERLIVGRAVSFSRTERGEPRITSKGCQCKAEYLPDGSMAWIQADGKPCNHKSTQQNFIVVPIASVRLTAIGMELLDTTPEPAAANSAKSKPVKTQGVSLRSAAEILAQRGGEGIGTTDEILTKFRKFSHEFQPAGYALKPKNKPLFSVRTMASLIVRCGYADSVKTAKLNLKTKLEDCRDS